MADDPAPGAPVVGLVDVLAERGWTLGVAESLTGGLLAATVVSVPGASRVLTGGVVAYDAAVKVSVLGVEGDLIARRGTVAEEVAVEMALGARRLLDVDLALATTGVAGPGPSEGHPAGTVWLACADARGVRTRRLALTGDRARVRSGAVDGAIALAREVGEAVDAGSRYGGV